MYANHVARRWVPESATTLADLCREEDAARAAGLVEAVRDGGAPRETLALEGPGPVPRRVEVTATSLGPAAESGVVLLGRDVTEAERERRRLRAITEMHDTLKQLRSSREASGAALRVFREHFPLGAGSVLTLNPGTRTLSLESAVGLPPKLQHFFENRLLDVDTDAAHPARAYREPGRVLVAPVAESRTLPAAVRDALKDMGYRASLATTMGALDGNPFGVLVLGFDEDVAVDDAGYLADEPLHDWVRVMADEVGTCMDRLRQNEALRDIVHRERRLAGELESFTYRTSHDLAEPLRGIGTLAEYAKDDLAREDAESVRELLERIGNTAERLKAMIGSLLELSRTTHRTMPATRWRLMDVARAASDELAPLMRERSATVSVDSPMPDVVAGRGRVHTVLKNLVENAIVHNPSPEPVVRVSARARDDGFVEVSVRDNGPGIPEEERDVVFDIFRGQSNGDKTGVGAGLTIARRAVEQEGGIMWVQEAPEGGADFRFTLPPEG